jgi:hypothetical protein
MKRVFAVVAGLVFVGAIATPVMLAQDKAAPKTITGPVVDISCDTGNKHAPDAACTMSCVKRGQAAGIKAADGTIYQVTGAYAANNNEKLVEFVSKGNVVATGAISEKDGKKMIDVSTLKVDVKK